MRMKIRSVTLALALSLAFASLLLAGGPPGTNPAPLSVGLTVPAETEVSVMLLSGLHTKIAQVRDPVACQLTQAIYVDGQLALPQGTLLYGYVTRVRPAGRLHRPAELGLRFDEVSLPSGETEPVTARLSALEHPGKMRLDREGYLKGGRQLSWNLVTGALVGSGGLMVIPKVAGATIGATVASVATAGVLGGYVLIPHGPEVHLPPDTRCRVRFDDSFTVHGQS